MLRVPSRVLGGVEDLGCLVEPGDLPGVVVVDDHRGQARRAVADDGDGLSALDAGGVLAAS
ncbi:hypothetical protein SAMN05216267_102797 [Actinacidiphila rubida]|uniref:Uncharacterized protein n=1 Tax=Actinacidiphila rubida TaxID=310780 RepID=A0A1H8PZT3_9ACTN|nr:hypothetical protein SAMN05216267_102797 [Actinacidiphila rubida]